MIFRRRQRDYGKCNNQRDVTRRRDRATGLSTLRHELASAHALDVDGAPATLLNVRLECDRGETPWCDCNGAPATEAPQQPVDPKDNIMPWLPRKRQKRKN